MHNDKLVFQHIRQHIRWCRHDDVNPGWGHNDWRHSLFTPACTPCACTDDAFYSKHVIVSLVINAQTIIARIKEVYPYCNDYYSFDPCMWVTWLWMQNDPCPNITDMLVNTRECRTIFVQTLLTCLWIRVNAERSLSKHYRHACEYTWMQHDLLQASQDYESRPSLACALSKSRPSLACALFFSTPCMDESVDLRPTDTISLT